MADRFPDSIAETIRQFEVVWRSPANDAVVLGAVARQPGEVSLCTRKANVRARVSPQPHGKAGLS